MRPLHRLDPLDGAEVVNVVIEVPKGSGSKFKYDPATGAFGLHRSLPAGLLFPYDYGFIPSTLGEDGDPLDVLAFLDTNAFAGCVVKTRLLGVITGTQKGERGGRVQNNILLAAHLEAVSWTKTGSLRDIPPKLLDEIEFFFLSYRNFQGKEFRVTRRQDRVHARRLLRAGMRRFEHSQLSE
ncbi:MAG: inorganic diphosphatase [Verrucomicrobiota bacterium]